MNIKLVLTGLDMYKKEETLKEVKVDVVNWVTYYIDEYTNEKWIEEHLYPEMHDGGGSSAKTLDKFPWE